MVARPLQTKHFSLTYPQSNFDLNGLLEFLKTRTNGANRVVEVIVCSEEHADGNLHRHAYVRFNNRIDLRRMDLFDFEGRHPNIQRTQNVNAWKNYIREDGEFLEWHDNAQGEDNIFELARTLNFEEFYERTRRNRESFMYARNAWEHVNSEQDQITIRSDPNPELVVNFPDLLNNFEFETARTNVIVGPTGCGKTVISLRKMQHPILFCSHIDQLKNFSRNLHRSILFDDMDFSHWPVTAQIHLADRFLPRAINRRYGTTLIPPGIQVSVTCNQRPFTWDPAINRRLNYLTLL